MCTHEQNIVRGLYCRSSYKGHAVDALASQAEEGRSKAAISLGESPSRLSRGYPNGATRPDLSPGTSG
jgi:hypothetical protein